MNKKIHKYQIGDIIRYKNIYEREEFGEIGLICKIRSDLQHKYSIYSFKEKYCFGWLEIEIEFYKSKSKTKS